MKRRSIMAIALALALVVSPLGQAGRLILSASSNSTASDNSTVEDGNTTEDGSDESGDTSTEGGGDTVVDTGAEGGSDTVVDTGAEGGSTADAGAVSEAAEEAAAQVTASDGSVLESTVPTHVMSDAVVVTTAESGVTAAASLEAGRYVELSVTNFAGELARQALANAAASAGVQIASIMDITWNVYDRDGVPAGNVTQFAAPIEFVVATPEIDGVDAQNVDFAVIRLHDGAATLLPDLDNDPATITFTSDQFSAYAVVYGAKGAFQSYTTASAQGVKDNVPKTGDALPIAVPVTATACLAAAAVVLAKKKEA